MNEWEAFALQRADMSEQIHMDYIRVYPSQRLLQKLRSLFIKASSKYETFAARHYTWLPSKRMNTY